MRQSKVASFFVWFGVVLVLLLLAFFVWAFLTEEEFYISWLWADDGSPCYDEVKTVVFHVVDDYGSSRGHVPPPTSDSQSLPLQAQELRMDIPVWHNEAVQLVHVTKGDEIRIGNKCWVRMLVPRFD